MISQLRGTLVKKGADHLVIDVGGVGYLLLISLQTLQVLPAVGQETLLYTHLYVREDALVLYGFSTENEREMFLHCISVSGVGPKLALSLLSSFEPNMLVDTIQRGDTTRLCRTPGIGKKTAERLILELKDSFQKFSLRPNTSHKVIPGSLSSDFGTPFRDVVTALCNLGYKPIDAEKAADTALKEKPDAPLAEILRQSLKLLQKG